MNKEEANKKAKAIFEDWHKKKKQIEKEAKENGKWQNGGLDSNNHLFKEIDVEAKDILEKLSSFIKEK